MESAVIRVKMKRRLTAAAAFLMLLLLTAFSSGAAAGASAGLTLFVKHILPSTFPFLVLAHIIGACAGKESLLPAFVVGSISGYPVGAGLCAAQKKRGYTDTVLTLTCCIGAGPGFSVSAVGSVLGSEKAGLLLFCAQILSSLTALSVLLTMRRKDRGVTVKNDKDMLPPFSAVFTDAVKNACLSMLYICGFVTFFSCALGMFAIPGGSAGMLLCGVIEVSNGCARASLTYGAAGFAALGGILGFGGVCVLFQLAAITEKSGITVSQLVISRLIAAALCALYSLILYKLFPTAVAVSFAGGYPTAATHSLPVVASLTLCVATLLCADASTGYVTLRRKKAK